MIPPYSSSQDSSTQFSSGDIQKRAVLLDPFVLEEAFPNNILGATESMPSLDVVAIELELFTSRNPKIEEKEQTKNNQIKGFGEMKDELQVAYRVEHSKLK